MEPGSSRGRARQLVRSGTFWAAVGSVAAVVGATTGVIVALNGSSTNVSDDDGPSAGRVTVQLVNSKDISNFTLPIARDDLPDPPDYEPDESAGGEFHCDVWQRWARQHEAAESYLPFLRVSAPVDAPAHVIGLKADVLQVDEPKISRIQCVYGAGGYAALTAKLDLDRPAAPVPVHDDDATRDFTIPPDGIRVDAGTTETIVLATEATPDRFYELYIEVEVVVDGKTERRTLGSKDDPLRLSTFEPDLALAVDWDPAQAKWIPAQEYFDARREAETR